MIHGLQKIDREIYLTGIKCPAGERSYDLAFGFRQNHLKQVFKFKRFIWSRGDYEQTRAIPPTREPASALPSESILLQALLHLRGLIKNCYFVAIFLPAELEPFNSCFGPNKARVVIVRFTPFFSWIYWDSTPLCEAKVTFCMFWEIFFKK